MTRVALCVAAIMAGGASEARTQAGPSRTEVYRAVLTRYATGQDLKTEIVPLQSWRRPDFAAAIDGLLVTGDWPEIESAAVLQLEFALAVAGASAETASEHIDQGARLLNRILERYSRGRPPPEVVELAAAWYGVAGSVSLSRGDARGGRPWIMRGLAMAPRSAALHTLRGTADELEAGFMIPDARASSGSQVRRLMDTRRRYALIADVYKKALDYDPDYAPAHLRLGRVHFVLGQLEPARTELERAEALATDPWDRYLAALLLGSLQQHQGEFPAARASYERAIGVASGQSAIVALGYLDLVTGRPDLAQARARAFLAAPADDPYWWEFRNGGVYRAGLNGLRSRVRR